MAATHSPPAFSVGILVLLLTVSAAYSPGGAAQSALAPASIDRPFHLNCWADYEDGQPVPGFDVVVRNAILRPSPFYPAAKGFISIRLPNLPGNTEVWFCNTYAGRQHPFCVQFFVDHPITNDINFYLTLKRRDHLSGE
jgi:hypothetical protein